MSIKNTSVLMLIKLLKTKHSNLKVFNDL